MSASIARVRRIHRLNAKAPACALVVFGAVLLGHGWSGSTVDRGMADRRVIEVGERVAAIPYRLGDWAGRDVVLPAAALEILHSSASVSRAYSNLRTGERARLAIVFCGDVRDMLGHHPPACYPSAGWTPWRTVDDAASSGSLRMKIHGREVEANVFRFRKPDPVAADREITIIGFFALPGVGLTPDPDVVRSRSTRRRLSSRGAGQIQVLLDGFPARVTAGEVARDLLESIPAATFDMLLDDPADESGAESGNAPGAASLEGEDSDARAEVAGPLERRVEGTEGKAGGEL